MSALPTRVRRPDGVPPIEVLLIVIFGAWALAATVRLIQSAHGDMGDERPYGQRSPARANAQ